MEEVAQKEFIEQALRLYNDRPALTATLEFHLESPSFSKSLPSTIYYLMLQCDPSHSPLIGNMIHIASVMDGSWGSEVVKICISYGFKTLLNTPYYFAFLGTLKSMVSYLNVECKNVIAAFSTLFYLARYNCYELRDASNDGVVGALEVELIREVCETGGAGVVIKIADKVKGFYEEEGDVDTFARTFLGLNVKNCQIIECDLNWSLELRGANTDFDLLVDFIFKTDDKELLLTYLNDPSRSRLSVCKSTLFLPYPNKGYKELDICIDTIGMNVINQFIQAFLSLKNTLPPSKMAALQNKIEYALAKCTGCINETSWEAISLDFKGNQGYYTLAEIGCKIDGWLTRDDWISGLLENNLTESLVADFTSKYILKVCEKGLSDKKDYYQQAIHQILPKLDKLVYFQLLNLLSRERKDLFRVSVEVYHYQQTLFMDDEEEGALSEAMGDTEACFFFFHKVLGNREGRDNFISNRGNILLPDYMFNDFTKAEVKIGSNYWREVEISVPSYAFKESLSKLLATFRGANRVLDHVFLKYVIPLNDLYIDYILQCEIALPLFFAGLKELKGQFVLDRLSGIVRDQPDTILYSNSIFPVAPNNKGKPKKVKRVKTKELSLLIALLGHSKTQLLNYYFQSIIEEEALYKAILIDILDMPEFSDTKRQIPYLILSKATPSKALLNPLSIYIFQSNSNECVHNLLNRPSKGQHAFITSIAQILDNCRCFGSVWLPVLLDLSIGSNAEDDNVAIRVLEKVFTTNLVSKTKATGTFINLIQAATQTISRGDILNDLLTLYVDNLDAVVLPLLETFKLSSSIVVKGLILRHLRSLKGDLVNNVLKWYVESGKGFELLTFTDENGICWCSSVDKRLLTNLCSSAAALSITTQDIVYIERVLKLDLSKVDQSFVKIIVAPLVSSNSKIIKKYGGRPATEDMGKVALRNAFKSPTIKLLEYYKSYLDSHPMDASLTIPIKMLLKPPTASRMTNIALEIVILTPINIQCDFVPLVLNCLKGEETIEMASSLLQKLRVALKGEKTGRGVRWLDGLLENIFEGIPNGGFEAILRDKVAQIVVQDVKMFK